MPASSTIQALRARIDQIEAPQRSGAPALPFGVFEIDARLPGGGLSLFALHEVAEGTTDNLSGAVSALFAAGIAARTSGPVLWCLKRRDLFAPALEQAGLIADRVIYVETPEDADALACFEEGLRHGGLGAVVCEVTRLGMTASRRLQLAAEKGRTLGVALRRWRRPSQAALFGQPTAASTRWRISSLPSAPLPVAGVGRARWRVELTRCRSGSTAAFEVEGCDEKGRLAMVSELAHRPDEALPREKRAQAG